MAAARRLFLGLIFAGLLSGEAAAQVEFGRDVFIAGHDFSHRRYKSVTITSTNRRPPWMGCRLLPAGAKLQGRRLQEPTQVCYLAPKWLRAKPGMPAPRN